MRGLRPPLYCRAHWGGLAPARKRPNRNRRLWAPGRNKAASRRCGGFFLSPRRCAPAGLRRCGGARACLGANSPARRPPSPLKRVRGCALRRAEFVDQERAPAPALVRPAREALAVVPGSGLSVGLRPCPCVAAPARRTVTRRRAAPPRVRRSSPSAPAPPPALLPPRPPAACPARGTTETANKGL